MWQICPRIESDFIPLRETDAHLTVKASVDGAAVITSGQRRR